jgi:hypothetical protein
MLRLTPDLRFRVVDWISDLEAELEVDPTNLVLQEALRFAKEEQEELRQQMK